MDAAAYRDALKPPVLGNDTHWHPLRRVQIAALRLNPGIRRDRQETPLNIYA
ncbi:MAG: hypothetical protein J2P36_23890 [Ktedonobacteraceae bacterium]|nr:hypothetical protein [Ktedonobacteraceae bacterium]